MEDSINPTVFLGFQGNGKQMNFLTLVDVALTASRETNTGSKQKDNVPEAIESNRG